MTSAVDLTHLHHLVHLPSRATALVRYPLSDVSKDPVLLIHGVHSAPGHLSLWRHKCEAAGLAPYCFSYPTRGTLPEIGDALAAAVLELHETHKHSVMLVGHSLGGVLAALVAVQLSSSHPTAVSEVVAVCSPFDGATLAKASFLGPSRHVLQELCHGSDLLTDLRSRLAADVSGTRWSSLGLLHDGVVTEASSRLPHPDTRHVTLSGENHLSVLVSTTVADTIANILKAEPTA
jgi:pimeloyl-ACP methyl ester carboxylesterase